MHLLAVRIAATGKTPARRPLTQAAIKLLGEFRLASRRVRGGWDPRRYCIVTLTRRGLLSRRADGWTWITDRGRRMLRTMKETACVY